MGSPPTWGCAHFAGADGSGVARPDFLEDALDTPASNLLRGEHMPTPPILLCWPHISATAQGYSTRSGLDALTRRRTRTERSHKRSSEIQYRLLYSLAKARFGEPHTLTRPCVHAGGQAWGALEPRSLTCAGKLRAPWSNLLPLDPWDDSDILRETHLGTCWPTWRRARKAWPSSDRHARIGDNLQRVRVAMLCMCYRCAVYARCMGTSNSQQHA